MKVTVHYGKSSREIALQYGLTEVVSEALLDCSLFSSTKTGEEEVEICTFNSDKYFDSSLEVVKELERCGFRPAVMQEFLTFIGEKVAWPAGVVGLATLGTRDTRDLPFMACVPFVYSERDDVKVSSRIHIGPERTYDIIHDLRERTLVVVKI